MTVVLPALSVSFAAFCIWLTVRIVNRREHWPKWALATAMGLPMLYVASFGPACWLIGREKIAAHVLFSVYRPIGPWAVKYTPQWWIELGLPKHMHASLFYVEEFGIGIVTEQRIPTDHPLFELGGSG